jgi:Helix-turn-helix domain
MRANRKPRKGWVKTPRLILALGAGKTSKAVLIALLSYADKKGVCWPSQETLRRDVSGSRRGAQRALDVLEGKAVKSSAHPPLVPPAIKRKPERGPGGVRRYVLAPWVLNADTSLGARVRHPDAASATSGTEDSTGASRRREGCVPRRKSSPNFRSKVRTGPLSPPASRSPAGFVGVRHPVALSGQPKLSSEASSWVIPE